MNDGELQVAVYARCGPARSGLPVDEQVARCREHACRQGWVVAETASDHASGGTAGDRPALRELLTVADAFDVILAVSPDRFGRDQGEFAELVSRAASAGCRVVTLSDGEAAAPHSGGAAPLAPLPLGFAGGGPGWPRVSS